MSVYPPCPGPGWSHNTRSGSQSWGAASIEPLALSVIEPDTIPPFISHFSFDVKPVLPWNLH